MKKIDIEPGLMLLTVDAIVGWVISEPQEYEYSDTVYLTEWADGKTFYLAELEIKQMHQLWLDYESD